MRNNTLFLYVLFLLISEMSSAQVGIGSSNPDASSVLDVYSTDKGFLILRLTTVQRDAISSPTTVLLNRPKVTYFKSVMAVSFDAVKLKNELSNYKIYYF